MLSTGVNLGRLAMTTGSINVGIETAGPATSFDRVIKIKPIIGIDIIGGEAVRKGEIIGKVEHILKNAEKGEKRIIGKIGDHGKMLKADGTHGMAMDTAGLSTMRLAIGVLERVSDGGWRMSMT